MIVISKIDQILAKSPILLWVEDRLTAEYLSIIWQDDTKIFGFGIAGGNETVRGVVKNLRKQGKSNVFGLIDRDFSNSNQSRWGNIQSEVDVFRPECHEIENFLLEWNAMEGCGQNNRHNRTQDEIRKQAENFAKEIVWWMACKTTLSDYRDRLIGNFSEHPPLKIRNQDDAEKYIRSTEWFISLADGTLNIPNATSLTDDLQNAHDTHDNQIKNGTWIREFSGKEIFRRLRGYLFNVRYASNEIMDIDFAKSIADWQVKNNEVPDELIELKEALKSRVGI